MKETTFTFPYEIGTYLNKIEDGIKHTDRICKYVVNSKGVFVVLLLDALTNTARESAEIKLDKFVEEWSYDEKTNSTFNDKVYKKSM